MSRAPRSTEPQLDPTPSTGEVRAAGRDAGADAFLRSGTDRRTMLRRVGMVALIGGGSAALAACSSSASNSAAPATSAPATSAAAPTSAASSAAPSETESASSSSSASASPSKAPSSSGPTADAAHTVAKSNVPEGSGTIGSDFVVTQPSSGSFKAFSNVCTHQGCMLTKVSGGTMNCPCHGSKFSITDGSVQAGPAPKPLPSKTVTVSGSNLLIGL